MENTRKRVGIVPLWCWTCAMVAVAAVIFWSSFFKPLVPGGLDINDKVGHGMAYAALGVCLCAIGARVRPAWARGRVILWAVVIGAAYGISLEFAQALFTSDRTCSVFDMLADLAGGGAGAGIWAGSRALAAQMGTWMRA